MVASTDIKFYVHSNNNAPQLQNAYGSMIGVLDACLVNGISLGQVSTLTAIGTTATAVFSTAHNLLQYQVLKITGANEVEYNGEHRILTVPNATSVTFQLGSAPSTTTATGTITASLPPLGWEKPFSSANASGGGRAAYRSKNVLLPSRPFLRVVDELDPAYTATYAKYAKVGIVEDMSDIDTMLGVQAPYDEANPDKNWVGSGSGTSVVNGWARWYYARSASLLSSGGDSTSPVNGNRGWLIVGNGDFFYVLPGVRPSSVDLHKIPPYGFGAFDSLIHNDNANTFLASSYTSHLASQSNNPSGYVGTTNNTSTKNLLLHRGYSLNGRSEAANCYSIGCSASIYSGVEDYIGSAGLAGLSPFAPVYIQENVLRGILPSLNWLFQKKPFLNNQAIENSNSMYIASDVVISGSLGQVIFYLGDL
ncbi:MULTISPECIES: hypothetical protein [unclassified Acinetobacter]|uniref:hypothetical protein n=1 Tax=unclassified Acinetobacter TaxID=196816 RepID=UPI0015D2BF38|nr:MULTISPECIES: hypothetical protein [unclassified Acinetobacter]